MLYSIRCFFIYKVLGPSKEDICSLFSKKGIYLKQLTVNSGPCSSCELFIMMMSSSVLGLCGFNFVSTVFQSFRHSIPLQLPQAVHYSMIEAFYTLYICMQFTSFMYIL